MKNLDELIIATEENSQILRDRLNELKYAYKTNKAHNFTFKYLNEKCNLVRTDDTKFSRFLGQKDNVNKLDQIDHERIVKYLADNKYWDCELEIDLPPDAIYYGINDFLKISKFTRYNLSRRVQGLYRVWRPSLFWRGRFILGMIEIFEYQGTMSMRCIETQRFKGSDGAIPREEVFTGYAFRKDKNYFLFSKDDSQKSIRMTMFHSVYYGSNEQIICLEGVATGVYGKHIYSSPTYLERWEGKKEELDSMLALVPENKVPESVLQKLRDVKQGDVFLF